MQQLELVPFLEVGCPFCGCLPLLSELLYLGALSGHGALRGRQIGLELFQPCLSALPLLARQSPVAAPSTCVLESGGQ